MRLLASETTNKKQQTPRLSHIVGVSVDAGPFVFVPRRRKVVSSQPVVWPPKPEITIRGGAAKIYADTSPEVMLSGPAETGKTFAVLYKVDTFLRSYPGAQVTIARKVRATMYGSVLKTYDRIRAIRGGVTPFGGQMPEWYDYPNGSRLWVAGLDNPGKALSSERDMIYVNQAEELDVEDWETLSTRATGRGAVAPWTQLLGDCNPSHPRHWIKQRQGLTFYESRHEDNPSLFRDDGTITQQGERTLAVLERLTGVRYLRLRKGLWAGAEGMVYDQYDPAIHLIDRFEIPSDWRRFRVIDFGYTNPFVCSWYVLDHDGRLYRYREIYRTQRTVEEHAPVIIEHSKGERYEATVADHDAEDRATLEKKGVPTTKARKDIRVGIQAVQDRLKIAGDGSPRLFFLKDSLIDVDESLRDKNKPLCTEDEIVNYVWPRSQDNKPVKEVPIQVDDHGMDTMRYAVMYADYAPQTSTVRNPWN